RIRRYESLLTLSRNRHRWFPFRFVNEPDSVVAAGNWPLRRPGRDVVQRGRTRRGECGTMVPGRPLAPITPIRQPAGIGSQGGRGLLVNKAKLNPAGIGTAGH